MEMFITVFNMYVMIRLFLLSDLSQDEKLASVAKVQPQVPVKEDSSVISPVYVPKVHKGTY